MLGLFKLLYRFLIIVIFSLVNIHALPIERQGTFYSNFFSAQAIAQDDVLDCSLEENKDGAKCQSSTLSETGKGNGKGVKFATASMYVSLITLIVSIFTSWLSYFFCKAFQSCGWGTKIGAMGGLLFLAAEIISIIKFKDYHLKKEVEYNPALLRQYQTQCDEGNTENVPKDSSGNSICDQRVAIQGQIDSYDAMLSAVKLKLGFYIAGEVVFGLAAIIEFIMGAIKKKRHAKILSYLSGPIAASCSAESARMTPANSSCASLISHYGAAMGEAADDFAFIATSDDIPSPGPSLSRATTLAGKYAQINTRICVATQTVWTTCCPAASTLLITELKNLTAEAFAKKEETIALAPLNGCTAPPATSEAEAAAATAQPSQAASSMISLTPPISLIGLNMITPPFDPTDYMGCHYASSPIPVVAHTPHKAIENDANQFKIIENLFQLILGNAIAGSDDKKSPKVGQYIALIGGGVAGGLLGLVFLNRKAYDTLFSKTWQRGLWFTGVAILAGINIILLVKAKKEIEKRIEQLEAILAATQATSAAITVDDTNIDYDGLANFLDSQKSEEAIQLPTPIPCPFGGDGKGNCGEPFSGQDVSLKTLGLGNLSGLSSNINGISKDMLGKESISGKSLSGVSALVRKAAAFKKFKKSLLGRVKKEMNADPTDLANELNNKMAGLIQNELQKNGQSPQSLLGGAGLKDFQPSEEEIQKALEKIEKEQPALASANPGDAGAGFDFELPTEENNDMELDALADQTVSGLEVTSDDINTNGDGNIFSLISTRYMKSGYPRLFDEQVTPTEAPALQEVSP